MRVWAGQGTRSPIRESVQPPAPFDRALVIASGDHRPYRVASDQAIATSTFNDEGVQPFTEIECCQKRRVLTKGAPAVSSCHRD